MPRQLLIFRHAAADFRCCRADTLMFHYAFAMPPGQRALYFAALRFDAAIACCCLPLDATLLLFDTDATRLLLLLR